jgi:transposase-like protein
MKTTKKRYSASVKAKAIEHYSKGKVLPKDLAASYGVNVNSIYKWIRKYEKHGSRGLKRTRKVYKISTKKRLDICRRYADEDITLAALGAEIGIGSSALRSWVKKFNDEGQIDLTARLKAKEDAKKCAIQLFEDWKSSGLTLSEFRKERNIHSSEATYISALALKNIDGHTMKQINEEMKTERNRELFRRVSEDGESMADVANSAGITLSYLRQKFVKLRQKGIIETPANCSFEKVGLVRKVQAILRDAAEEGKSVREAAADRGVSELTIYYWRKKIIDAGEADSIAPKEYKTDAVSVTASEKQREHKFRPVNMSDAKKIALLKKANSEGLCNQTLADKIGVSNDTITRWRREFEIPGKRGTNSVLTEQEKRDLLARGEHEGLRLIDMAKIAGVSKSRMCIWKQQIAEIDRKTAAPQEDEQMEVGTVTGKAETLDVRRMAKLTLPGGAVIEAEMTMSEARELLAG